MRRLEVDRAREGDGSLVGHEYSTGEAEPYAVPPVREIRTERVTDAERRLLSDLTELAETRDLNDERKYGTVTLPSDLFLKLVNVWLT